jgi:hypothetical protein
MMEATFRVGGTRTPSMSRGGECGVTGASNGRTSKNICAEGNFNLFDYKIPVAHKPDF